VARASIYREKMLDERTGHVRAGQTWYLQVVHNGKRYTRSARTLDKTKAMASLRQLQAEVYEAEHDRAAAAQIARTAVVKAADGSSGWRWLSQALTRGAYRHGSQLGARAAAAVRGMARLGARLAQSRAKTAEVRDRVDEEGWQGYCLSQSEEARLLAAAPPFLQDLMTFLLGTGAEPGEAMVLTWGDLDLDSEVATVCLGGGPGRIVPLPEAVRELLEGLQLKAADFDRVFLAAGSFGRRVPLEDAAPAFRVSRKKANLSHLELRDLRYTYAARLIASGVGSEDASILLGAPLRV